MMVITNIHTYLTLAFTRKTDIIDLQKGGIILKIHNSRRLYFVDTLETICIFCVIFYHAFSTSVDVRSYDRIVEYYIKSCLSISIPLFFTVNGGLLLNKELNLTKHIFKMIHLIFLVCIWDVINVTIKMFVYHKTLSWAEILKKLWYFEPGWSNQLWYLMALFVIYAFFPLLKSSYDHTKKTFLFFSVIVFAVVFGNSLLNMILSTTCIIIDFPVSSEEINFFNQFNPLRGLYGYTFAYFILGGFLFSKIDILQKKLKPIYAAAGYVVSIGFLTTYGIIISVKTQEVWDTVSSSFSTVFVLAAALCVFRLSLLCSNSSESRIRKIIENISRNSLGIYLFQSLLADVCYTYYIKLPVSQNLLGDLIFSLCLFILCNLLTSLCKKVPYLKFVCTL